MKPYLTRNPNLVMSEPRPICPRLFLDVSETVPLKSYAVATTTSIIPIESLPLPIIHDGRTTITVSEEGYQSGLEKCKHMLLGLLHLSVEDKPYSSSELCKKLGLIWGEIGHWRVIPMGKGYFLFSFSSDATLSLVWEKGVIALKPGILRFMRWMPKFSPANLKNTNAQIWVNFWDLGLEFWEPLTLFEIANGIGVLMKIDQNTLDRTVGLFARVLIDIDLSVDPPCELGSCDH